MAATSRIPMLAAVIFASCFGATVIHAQVPASGLVLRLRSDEGVVEASGLVSQWDDQSGNGNDALQADPSRQPQLVPGELSGLPVLRFDGTDDVLGLTGTTSMNQVTLCIVERLSGATGNGYYPIILGGETNITGQYYGLETHNDFSGNSPEILDIFAGFHNDARAQYPYITEFETWRIIVATTDQMIANTSVRMNGARAQMTTTGANVPILVQLGNATGTALGGIGGSGKHLVVARCDVAEVLVYDRVLSGSEQEQLENYLADRYAIDLVECPERFTEDFDGTDLSPRWVQVGSCGPATVSDGTLVLSKPQGCGALLPRGTVGVQSDPSLEVLCGDFDIRVEFTLTDLTIPAPSNARYTGLLLKPASALIGVEHVAAIERHFSGPGVGCAPYPSAYKVFGQSAENCSTTWVESSDITGKFRMVRRGSTVDQYYWDEPTWVLARSGAITTDPLAIVLYTGSTSPDPQEVRYDRLRLLDYPTGAHDPQLPVFARIRVAPNPLHSAMTVSYSLSRATHVQLGVYDVAGRRVALLADEFQGPGPQLRRWEARTPDGSLLPVGVYMLRLMQDGREQVGKFVVAR